MKLPTGTALVTETSPPEFPFSREAGIENDGAASRTKRESA